MNHPVKLAALFCLLSVPAVSFAHTAGEGYAHDSSEMIVRDGAGGCVKTPRWTPELARPECAGAASAMADSTPAAFRKLEFGAEVLFDTGRADFKPGVQSSLGKLVADLKKTSFEKVSIIGHADRTGNAAANQRLSERRANAVHNYLISEGIAADKLSGKGAGDTQPTTKPGACDNLNGAALKNCLAPDRRVEIRIYDLRAK